jgi:hypothetical protein
VLDASKDGDGSRDWLGRVLLDGTYQPSREANGRTEAITQRLRAFAADPAKVAAEHGRLTGCCCFCAKTLTDERSTAVGYGQTCAGHYGLPWGAPEKAADAPKASAGIPIGTRKSRATGAALAQDVTPQPTGGLDALLALAKKRAVPF